MSGMVYNADWTSQARKKSERLAYIKPRGIRKKNTMAKKKFLKEGKPNPEVIKMPTGHRVEEGE